jgi:hypothetical protein
MEDAKALATFEDVLGRVRRGKGDGEKRRGEREISKYSWGGERRRREERQGVGKRKDKEGKEGGDHIPSTSSYLLGATPHNPSSRLPSILHKPRHPRSRQK